MKFITVDIKGRDTRILLMLSVFYPVLAFIFESIGINMVTSAEAGIMMALYPIITTLLAIPVLKEYPNRKQVMFICFSAFGVMFINYMQYEIGNNIQGYMILLAGVFFGSLQGVLSRKASVNFSPVEITYIMIAIAACSFNAYSFSAHIIKGDLMSYFFLVFNVSFISAVLYLAIACSVVSFFLLNYLYSKLEASRIGVITNIATIISILAGVLVLGEKLYWFHIIGILVILLGVFGTNYYKTKNKIIL